MRHLFMEHVARALAARGIATLRYEFPYMEQGRKRPDAPEVAVARVREAVAATAALWPHVPLFAGGKSFGGRMTSTAQAAAPLTGVRGLVFFGFPLHPPGRPGIERAEHLDRISIPMLFVQGARDEFAAPGLLAGVIARLADRATLHLVEGADHSFKVRGIPVSEVVEGLAGAVLEWCRST